MDFHCLSRKDLQALCKKNKIPANTTNVAMADALQSLQLVEGLEEFLNSAESDCQQVNVGMESVPRTATRTSTRQKPGREELGSSKETIIRSRRVARAVIAEEIEQENNDVNSSMTPAVPTTRRRAPAASALKKIEMESEDDERNDCKSKTKNVFETPGVQSSRRRGTVRTVCKKMETPNEGNSLQKAYSTRRSMRLLEKGIASLSLCQTDQKESTKCAEISVDAIEVSMKSNQTEEIKVRSLGPECAPFNERCDGIDVASIENKTSDELETEVSDSKLDLGHPDDSEVMESSDESDIPENKKEVDVNNESEDTDSNIVSHPTSEQVNVKRSSSDDCNLPGDESDVAVMKNVHDMKVEEKNEMVSHPTSEQVNVKRSSSDDCNVPGDESDVPVMKNVHDMKVEEKDEMVCPMICSLPEGHSNDPISSYEKPDSEIEPELTEESKDEVVTIASDNQNTLSKCSLDVQVGSANEDPLEYQLPSRFPRTNFSTTAKESVGEKQAERFFDDVEGDGEAENKDTVKEYMICNKLEKQVERIVCDKEDDGEESRKDSVKENMICEKLKNLSVGSLKRRIKKRIVESKSKSQDGDLMVEEKRTASLPVEENCMPGLEVHNNNRDV